MPVLTEKKAEAYAHLPEEHRKALESTLKEIEKRYGKGAIFRLGEFIERHQVEVWPTGLVSLDYVFGVGGLPKGRVVEVYGPESGGKTTLALTLAAQVQKQGGVVAFVDAEHALDPRYAERLGVSTADLLLSQPDSGETALEIVEVLARSGAVDLVVVDSVAALAPAKEIEGEMGEAQVGLQARLMSQALRKLTAVLAKTKTTALFINQVRDKVGGYGPQEVTPGGRALKFYASVRLEVRRSAPPLKEGKEVVGIRVRVKAVKNKLAPPFREAEMEVRFGRGFDPLTDLLEVALRLGAVERAGTRYSFGQEVLGRGREEALKRLKEEPALGKALEEAVRERMVQGASWSLASGEGREGAEG